MSSLPADATATNPEVLSLADFLKILRKRWYWIAAIALLAILVAAGLTAAQPKWYEAQALIRVEKADPETTAFRQQMIDFYDPYFVREQLMILESEKTLAPVIEQLGLRRIIAEWEDYPVTEIPMSMALLYFQKRMINLESSPGTSVIEISVLAKDDAQLAANIANAIVATYERDRIRFATENQDSDIRRLKEELAKQEQIVATERDNVERIRAELGIAGEDLNAREVTLENESLRQIQRTALSLRVDVVARRTRWEQFASVPREERAGLVNVETVPDQNIQQLSQAFLVAEQQYVRLRNQLGEAHPDFVAARESLDKVRSQLESMLDGYEKSLEIGYRESQARLQALEEELASARASQIANAGNRVRQFDDAVSKLKDEETLLKAFRISLRQKEIDYQAPRRTVEVLSKAEPPRRAAKPSWPLNLGLAALGGIVLGTALMFLLDLFDQSFRSVAEMERRLQLPILGVVLKQRITITPENFGGFEAEPYRVIQTNLDLARTEDSGNVLAVQSSGPGEGKSTTLRNLAALAALGGRRVVVIDSDLRRPTQHKLFSLDRKPGLCEFLRGEAKVEDIVRPTSIPNLFVITAGSTVNFSLSVLHQKPFRELIDRLREDFDRVFLDSPPVVGISDAAVIASLADGIVFVIQHRRTPQLMTQRARQIIASVDGRLLGVVLNQVPHRGSEDYNYYTSNYYYYRRDHEDEKAAKSSERKSSGAKESEKLELS